MVPIKVIVVVVVVVVVVVDVVFVFVELWFLCRVIFNFINIRNIICSMC